MYSWLLDISSSSSIKWMDICQLKLIDFPITVTVSNYVRQGGSVFAHVCQSVNKITQKLLIKCLWNFTEWLNII